MTSLQPQSKAVNVSMELMERERISGFILGSLSVKWRFTVTKAACTYLKPSELMGEHRTQCSPIGWLMLTTAWMYNTFSVVAKPEEIEDMWGHAIDLRHGDLA